MEIWNPPSSTSLRYTGMASCHKLWVPDRLSVFGIVKFTEKAWHCISDIQLVADDAASAETVEASPALVAGLRQAYTLPAKQTVSVSIQTDSYSVYLFKYPNGYLVNCGWIKCTYKWTTVAEHVAF